MTVQTKLNKLEEIQNGIVKDVYELKQSLRDSQQKIEEKADGTETAVLTRRKIAQNVTTCYSGRGRRQRGSLHSNGRIF